MKAAVHQGIGEPLKIEELDVRGPGPGEILVEMRAAAVCVTDVLATKGVTLVPTPFVSGHSGTGIVREIGPGVTRFSPGQRIATAGSCECGICYPCVQGTPSACDEIAGGMLTPRVIGYRDGGEAVYADGGVGVFAEHTVLREHCAVAFDADIDDDHAALLGCGVIGGLGAVLNVGRVPRGSTVAIVGCGHLGLWMVQAAVLAGAGTIIAVEHNASRRAVAAELGATHLVDPAAGDSTEQVRDLSGGRGADVALEAGGTVDGIEQAFSMTRGGGVTVTTSMAYPSDQVRFGALDVGVAAKTIVSSQSGGGFLRRDIPLYARLLERGDISASKLVSQRFGLADINAAFAAADAQHVLSGVICFDNAA